MNLKVYNIYSAPMDKGEPGGGERITSDLGYIPSDVQINALIDAGLRLDLSRAAYDFDELSDTEVELVVPDPTRAANFDAADASEMRREALSRIRRSARESIVEPTPKGEPAKEE